MLSKQYNRYVFTVQTSVNDTSAIKLDGAGKPGAFSSLFLIWYVRHRLPSVDVLVCTEREREGEREGGGCF